MTDLLEKDRGFGLPFTAQLKHGFAQSLTGRPRPSGVALEAKALAGEAGCGGIAMTLAGVSHDPISTLGRVFKSV